ncbi:STAS/SEC14 domain-containing protein [Agromyces sp. LHK192]|uniref:STAS/SEC14 domain-containing protein n=1 Tax=Agromyces sp. LHK192 TaxID=2498704 RepID=UPI000FDC6948|nr:STAS/SEC14 domain-containing protein [Agromyces sp. LHK192]
MIEPLRDLPDGVLGFRIVGTLEASDYRDVFDPAIDETIADGRGLHLVVVMDEAFDHLSFGGMIEDAKLLGRPLSAWKRAAFVTDHDVLAGIATVFGGLVPGAFKVFPLERRDAAIAWAAEGVGADVVGADVVGADGVGAETAGDAGR